MDKLLKPREAAALIGVTTDVLAHWRMPSRDHLYGHQLPYFRVGKSIRYREEDVIEWQRNSLLFMCRDVL